MTVVNAVTFIYSPHTYNLFQPDNFGHQQIGRPRNRWQDEVREDGKIVGGEGWQEKVHNTHNTEELKKLLRSSRNRRILHTPKE